MTLMILVTALLLMATGIVSTEIGCCRDDERNRSFSVPASNVYLSNVSPATCRYACVKQHYKYAALQQANLCFCDNENTCTNAGICDAICTGNTSNMCGGYNMGTNVYYTPYIVRGLIIQDPGILVTHENSSLNVTHTSGTPTTYHIEVQDGSPAVDVTSSPITHRYKKPGKYATVIKATDAESNSAITTKLVHVQSRIKQVQIKCPEAVEINTKFDCTIEIMMGTDLTATVNFDDGKIVPIKPADTINNELGSTTWDNSVTGLLATSQMNLMFNHIAKSNGTVVGWKYNARQSGRALFQVLRPTCPSGQTFCVRSYTCITETSNCRKQPNKWSKKCNLGGGEIYSISKQACISRSTGQVITKDFITDYTVISSLPTFTIVHELEVTLQLGENYVSDDDHFFASAGDVMAINQDSGALHFQSGTTACYELTTSGVGFTLNSVVTLTAVSGTCISQRHLLEVHMVQPSFMAFSHNYTAGLNIYNMTVDLKNDVTGTVVDFTLVDVQEVIKDVRFNISQTGTTNISVGIFLWAHTGNKVTYNWTFGDGEENVTMFKDCIHTFQIAGVYQVTVVAWNKISQATWMETIIIQDSIQNLVLTPRSTTYPQSATVHGQVTWVDLSLLQGTNVTYVVTFGDDLNETLYHDQPIPALAAHNGIFGYIGHAYKDPGNYTFTINVHNLISNDSATVFLPVQIPITGFSIIQPPAVAIGEIAEIRFKVQNGSHIDVVSFFAGAVAQNFSFDEQARMGTVFIDARYNINIGTYTLEVTADNLVTTKLEDSSTVYVDYNLTDLAIAIDRPFVPTTETGTWNVTMRWGSRYSVKITWDDGNVESQYINLTNPGEYLLYTHVFVAPGTYVTVFTFKNIFGTFFINKTILAQHSVRMMELAADSPISRGMNSSAKCTLTISFTGATNGVALATDPFILYHYGDGVNSSSSSALTVGTVTPDINIHYYSNYGTYNLTLNISNLVNHMFFERIIDVDKHVTNVTVYSNQSHIISGSETTIKVSMTWGSRMTLTFDFKDGTKEVQQIDHYDNVMESTHRFNQPGIYPVTVMSTNTLDNITTVINESITVQNPIKDMYLTCTAASFLQKALGYVEHVNCDLWLKNSTAEPTSVNLNVSWGDGMSNALSLIPGNHGIPSKTMGSMRHFWQFQHTQGYKNGGDFTVDVELYNLISNMTLNFSLIVYEEIDGFTKNLLRVDNSTGNSSTGFGSQNDAFRMEEVICFETEYIRGSHVTYVWDFGDGEVKTVYNQPKMVHKYLSPGQYMVTLNASNPFIYKVLQKSILVQRQVSGLSIWTETPRPKNRTLDFQLNVGNIGSNACYFIQFGDPNGTYLHYFLGKQSQCEKSFPTEWSFSIDSKKKFEPKTDLELENIKAVNGSANVTISNHYMTVGVYLVSVIGENIVSREEISFPLVITKGPCYNPIIDLNTPNECSLGEPCYNGIRTTEKSKTTYVYSKININCEATDRAYFNWEATTEDDNGNEVSVDLKDTTTFSTSLHTLVINPRILPYGLVKFSLNISMDDVPGVETVESVTMKIVASPLVGEIVGGPERAVKWNINITLDGKSAVSDPDIGPNDWTGFTWRWYCKRRCENWQDSFIASNYTNIANPEVFTSSCTYNVLAKANRGCFQFDNKDYPGQFGGSDGTVTFDTYQIAEGDVIELIIVAAKDTRTLLMKQVLHVVEGDPPDISIQCVSNCVPKTLGSFTVINVNPTARFSLMSVIEGWRRGMIFNYLWILHKIPIGYDTTDIDQYKIDPNVWKNGASTGIVSDNLAIDQGFFLNSEFKGNFFYRIKVEAVRYGNSADNKGWGTKDIVLNDPPVAGECYIYPPEGQALEDLFNFNCTKDFTDEEYPLKYETGYRKNTTGQVSWFYSGKTFHMDSPVYLPAGFPERNYTIEVLLKATDAIGSSTVISIPVKVLPASKAREEELLSNLTANPQEFSNSLSQSSPTEAAQQCMNIGEVLNSRIVETDVSSTISPPVDINDPSLSEAEKQAAAEAQNNLEVEREIQQAKAEEEIEDQRELVMKALTYVNLPDLAQMSQVMYASQAVGSKPDQLNADCRDAMLDIADKGVELLFQESSKDNVMADDLEAGASACMLSFELINESINVRTGTSTTSTSSSMTTSSSGITVQKSEKQIQFEQEQARKREEEKKKCRDQVNKSNSLMKTMSMVIGTKKVPGERATVIPSSPTAKTLMTIDKAFTRDSDYRVITGNSNSKIILPKAKVIAGSNENETTYYSQYVSVTYAQNVYTYGNQTGVDQSTSLQSLVIYNDTGDEVPCHNLKESFEIVLSSTNGTMPGSVNGIVKDDAEIHMIEVRPNNALHINVQRYINITAENSTSSTGNISSNSASDTWSIYIGINRQPTTGDFNFNCTLPLSDQERLDMVKAYKAAQVTTVTVTTHNQSTSVGNSTTNTTASNGTFTVQQETVEISYILPDKWTCFISNDVLNSSNTLKAYIIVKHSTRDNSTNSESSSDEDDTEVAYKMMTYITQCLWWDDNTDEWLASGCKVLPMTDYKKTYCACNHLTSFGGGFFVPMNTIDLSDSAFLKLDENPLVFAVMVSIMCLYVLAAIWARRMDLSDEVAAGSTALLDNDPREKYLYELVVFTGQRRSAGTTAKVSFILTGDQTETGPRLMWDNKRPVLKRKSVDSFIMAVKQPLGNLMHLRIWHDNSGNNPSWYFSRMQVTDMQTGQKFFFICDRWLAVEEDDGMLDRIVPVSGKAELTSFSHLFWTKTQKNLTDGHIWFSVFQRPPRSRFTRVQRLTCCLALLFTSMMASILFYNQGDVQQPGAQVYRLGPINFTVSQIYVGVVSGLIAFPASIIIVGMFRYSREWPFQRKKTTVPQILNNTRTVVKNESKAADNTSLTGSLKGSSDTDNKTTLLSALKTSSHDRADRTSLTSAYHNSRNTEASLSAVDFVESELKQQKEYLDTGDVSKRLLLNSTPPSNISGGVSYVSVGGDLKPTVQYTQVVEINNTKDKKCMLPWWFVIVGYIFALITISVAFWMTVEVAGVFGAKKSGQWLFSFVISVFESIFLSQPLKVLLMALFMALLCRKPEEEEDDRPRHLKPNEEWLHTHLNEKDMEDPETVKILKKYNQGPMELDEEYIKAAREERFKELKMYSIIREIIFYVIFLYLMMMVAYGNRDPSSITMYNNYKSIFHDGAHYLGLNKEFSMDKIHSRDDFWNWLKFVALPSIYHPTFYDGKTHSFMEGFMIDNQAYLIGEAQLRMLRVKPEPCNDIAQSLLNKIWCSYSYGSSDLDKGHYKKGWVKSNTTAGEGEDRFWEFHSHSDLNGYPYWGRLGTYSGGGYVAQMGTTLTTAESTIDELIEYRWITDETKAIFVEFLLYNPNANLFGISQILFEYTQTGASYSYYKFHIMRLNRYIGSWMFVVMAAELLALLFIVFYIYKEIRKAFKEKKMYLKSFWNCVELFILSLCIVAVVMFFYRLFIGQRVETRMKENPQKYVNFQYVILWDEIYTYLLGMIIFMSTIKFLKLLRFNHRMSQMTSTINYASKSLISYMFMFFIIFCAFVQLSYLMFYSVLFDFSTFIRSAETMFSLMLNKFDFQTMREADRIFAPVIVFIFTLFVSFILINIFISIVLDAYLKVRHDISKQSNEYEIVDFMIQKFKQYSGIGSLKRRKKKHDEQLDYDPSEYIDGIDPNAATAEELRERVTTMLDKLEMYVMHTMTDKETMEEVNKMTAKQPRKILVSS